ncbi:amphi-Trp domain-containing protein [Natronobacterium texcoconense]|uniref:Amphi-Trp domain-containing protein n=1 Tax=Natronobacterium texcoconense TaxID=1095778 RepID=A0A1H1B4H4_NATTX|nr:amphi-Trp domain-containing protein [Natronobacterium texcoconense]SDQ46839.1 amphi-Trp domain-containing protein [Natronobacterium texcoconense]
MSEKTKHKDEVPREEAADLLQELAREVRSEGTADVRVGNKTLTLTPGRTVDYTIKVEERSPMLGGDHEEVTVSLEWEVEEAETD